MVGVGIDVVVGAKVAWACCTCVDSWVSDSWMSSWVSTGCEVGTVDCTAFFSGVIVWSMTPIVGATVPSVAPVSVSVSVMGWSVDCRVEGSV